MDKILCNLQDHCFSERIKIAQFYFSVMAHHADVERFFLDAATNPGVFRSSRYP